MLKSSCVPPFKKKKRAALVELELWARILKPFVFSDLSSKCHAPVRKFYTSESNLSFLLAHCYRVCFFSSPLSLLYFLLAVQIIEYILASIWNNTVLCSVQPHLRSPITTKVQNLELPCVTLACDEDWLHLKHSHCGRTCWWSELKILGCWLGGLVKSHYASILEIAFPPTDGK